MKLSRLSRHFLDHPDTSHIIQTHFLDYLDTFQIIQKHFLDFPDTFQIVRKLSRSSRHFQMNWTHFEDYLDTFRLSDTFQIIQTLFFHFFIRTLSISSWTFSRLSVSGNFQDHPDTSQIIQRLCILSGYFIQHPDIFQIIRKLLRQ